MNECLLAFLAGAGFGASVAFIVFSVILGATGPEDGEE